eukprot:6393719-Pyramimonas_sp.AAC.1
MKDGVVGPAMNTTRIDVVPKGPGSSPSRDGLSREGSNPGLLKGREPLATRSDGLLDNVIAQTVRDTPPGSSISFQHPQVTRADQGPNESGREDPKGDGFPKIINQGHEIGHTPP